MREPTTVPAFTRNAAQLMNLSPLLNPRLLPAIWLLTAAGLCGAQTPATLVSGEKLLQQTAATVQRIDTAGLQQALADNPELVLLDLRNKQEINVLGGSIKAPRNINIPRGWLEFRVQQEIPDPDTPIAVYCGTNLRSPLAVKTLLELGYTNVTDYEDGFIGWRDQGLPIRVPDKAPDSMLYSKPEQVIDGVWSAIGETGPASYQNSGHNNNLSFIVTSDGVLVVNASDNYLLAWALHNEIKKVTDQPVKYVVLENGQGHAALGTSYWQQHGATVIAHADAAHEIENDAFQLLDRMRTRNREKALGTEVALPDETFEDQRVIEMGGERIELLHLGPAHSPGDIVVWLPRRKLVISGDMAFHQRMLPVFEHTDTAAWINTWDKFAALGAEVVIPGHGAPTTMAEVTRTTRDYLVYVREKLAEVIDNGGDLQDAYLIDQTPYANLDTYDILATQNAGRIFRAMEFEF